MLHRLLQEFKGAVITVLYPMVVGVEELPPCLVAQPVMLDVLECFVEPLYGPWCLGRLVLDQAEPCLNLFPKRSLPFLPDASCFCGHHWEVLCGQAGCSSLGCPWVLLQKVLFGD